MLVVLAITTLIVVLVTESILTFYRANTNTLEQAIQVDEARRGVDRMVHDLREVAYADDGSYPIASMSTSSVTFYSDFDRDASAEKVRYYLQGTVLRRGVINATGTPPTYSSANEQVTVVSLYVRNSLQSLPVFRYYNASSTEVAAGTATTSIRSIRVDMIVNVDANRLPGEFTLRSMASLRNLKN